MDRSPDRLRSAGLRLPSAPALQRLSEARARMAGGPQPPVSPGGPASSRRLSQGNLGTGGGTNPSPAQQAEGHGQDGCSRPQAAPLRPSQSTPPTQARAPPRGAQHGEDHSSPHEDPARGGLTRGTAARPQASGVACFSSGLWEASGSRAVPAGAPGSVRAPAGLSRPPRAHSYSALMAAPLMGV